MEAYPEYRQSGIKWVGKIPKHWEVCRLKLISRIENGATPSTNVPDFWNGHINWITPVDLSSADRTYIDGSERKITKEGLDSCGASLVPSNSIILSTRAPIGHINITTQPTCTNQGCRSIILSKGNSLFYYYLLSSAKEELQSLGTGSTFKELSSDDLKNMAIPFPPIGEQHNIAHYLELYVQRIDDLIKKKQRLIELLKEQRAAIINQAVTKGLNPNVKMKDSGVEWLGEIPEHWEIRKLIYCMESYVDYRGRTPEKVDEGVFLITARNVGNGRIDYEISKEYISEEEYRTVMGRGLPRKGDVIFTTEAPLGAVAQIDNERIALAQRIIKLRGKNGYLDNTFLKYLIMSSFFQYGIYRQATGSTAQGIKGSKFKLVELIIPSINEQLEIAEYLDQEIPMIDQLIGNIIKQIKLLQEYRTALISEAVTGKIDVREE